MNSPAPLRPLTRVAAAVIWQDGRFLLARRPPGKVYDGWWEFPGGKLEAGETSREALDRELHEELGVHVVTARPWLTRHFDYPHAHVALHFFHVTAWDGTLTPLEHDAIAWLDPLATTPEVSPILPANAPILKALALPDRLRVTAAERHGPATELDQITASLAAGCRLVQLRDKTLPAAERLAFAQRVRELTRRHAAQLIVNDDEPLARACQADGLHLSNQRLMAACERPDWPLVGASVHEAKALVHAGRLALDYAVLGPVLATPSHPDATPLGWPGFAALAAQTTLPLFAIGGQSETTRDTALAHGAHGIAGIRGI